MMKKYLLLLFACLLTMPVLADKKAEARGDSIYDRLVEYSIKREIEPLLSEKDAALELFKSNGQWSHYYFISTICSTAKVLSEGQTMTGLKESRALYEYARDNNHDYGRGVVLAQIAWLYGYIGDHEESVRQMEEAFRILRRYALEREALGLSYSYAYALELTKRYDDEARLLTLVKGLMRRYEWSDTSSVIYKTYRDNLLNAEALLEVRRGRMARAGRLVNQLQAKLANGDERNEYEALRAIAEYHHARGDYDLALATTDSMAPLAANSGLQWGLSLLRTEILRKLGRSDEAYDQLRPMIDLRSSDRLGQLRQQLTELETMTELEELRICRHRMRFWYAIGIALVIIIALCVYTMLRVKSARRLKKANIQLQQAYDQLEETTTAKERIESELRIARDIQMSMVPSDFPTCDRLDIFARMTPAKEVGGDLYDAQLIDGCRLYFCVGDVSGKGVPASLFMAQTIRLFRAMAKQGMPSADIATYLNIELCEGNDSAMFVTMFIGLIQLETGRLEFCNCGHNPPIIGMDNGQWIMDNDGVQPDAAKNYQLSIFNYQFLEVQPNAPIGIIPDMSFEGETIDDIRNKPLFIYTDGLNEAENPSLQQLGDERLIDYLCQTPFTTAKALIDGLTDLVARHRDGAEPNDDLTMLCIRLKDN